MLKTRLLRNKLMKRAEKSVIDELIMAKMFYIPSSEIYGGISGIFDLGPLGTGLQNNIISLWRKMFVIEDGAFEYDNAILTCYDVLKTSGHVDEFTDNLVRDLKTGVPYRADVLLKDAIGARMINGNDSKMSSDLRRVDVMSASELDEKILEYEVLSEAGNALSKVERFNLMFETQIGMKGPQKMFLRPETTQGHAVNFKRLLNFNRGQIPFSSAQVGRAFRNEISPRNGLIRVREFMMAEVEYYTNPNKKTHPRFLEVSETRVPILSRTMQASGSMEPAWMCVSEAVASGVIDNEVLGYFIARAFVFLTEIGVPADKLRFRQHLKGEMAHYATDCWDGEILLSCGWVECLGCADRASYDLMAHSKMSNQKLTASENLEEPRRTSKLIPVITDKKTFGMKFRDKAVEVLSFIQSFSQKALLDIKNSLDLNTPYPFIFENTSYSLTPDFITIEPTEDVTHINEFYPCIIEPSFGIGRLVHALIEHSCFLREDEERRAVFSFLPKMAPIKVLVCSVVSQPMFQEKTAKIEKTLKSASIPCILDFSSGSIGKKYARADESGIPFALTVDRQTLNDDTITIRERDTMVQIRKKTEEAFKIIKKLAAGTEKWNNLLET